jgi:hypothetical protein
MSKLKSGTHAKADGRRTTLKRDSRDLTDPYSANFFELIQELRSLTKAIDQLSVATLWISSL